jgi:hypothetical protein
MWYGFGGASARRRPLSNEAMPVESINETSERSITTLAVFSSATVAAIC